jgi:glycosyltransferase involved in cell wall biosynthesis
MRESETVSPVGRADDAGRPSVAVVVPTHNRPELVRRAVQSVLDQEYAGALEVLVVFDRADPDMALEQDRPGRSVRVLKNDRTPGLAGSRNTGILSASAPLVAFCDDDDLWLPGKLETQVAALEAAPEAEFVTTAMTVDYRGERSVRLAGRDRVDHVALIRSRMAMLHSSSFLIRRAALLDGIGLVDETLPRSMAEDWDLLIRASARRPILHVDEPLVEVTWGASSYFSEQWSDRNDAHAWMLDRYPEIAADRTGAALMYSKLAFGCAALGQRRAALRWAGRSIRTRWREPRAWIALAVTARIVSWQRVSTALNRRGHGI